jgi:hypothetical protein
MRNNLVLGIVAGAVAAGTGAAIWAAVTLASGWQIGWMAVGVGFLVGFAVRIAGQGGSIAFSVAGAALALIGCLAGNFLTSIGLLSHEYELGFFEMLGQFNYGATGELLAATFSPMDLLFYGIAIYEGFKLSVVPGGEAVAGPAEG